MNKFERKCPKCEETLEYLRQYDRDQANKIDKLCYTCKMKEKHGNPEDWFRQCPTCEKKITYTNKGNMQAANKANKACLKCTKNEKRGTTDFHKECPVCDEMIYFKNKVSLDESTTNNAKCGKCRSIEAVERQTGVGNRGMMISKFGEKEGKKKFKESEVKRLASFNKYWKEHPEQYLELMEKRKQFKCKIFYIKEFMCRGTSEKYYIENLIKKNEELPKNTKGVSTPYGYYFPDFEFENRYIEIKSEYTYSILKNLNNKQYLKMKWVVENIKPIEIIISDFYKKEIYFKEIINY